MPGDTLEELAYSDTSKAISDMLLALSLEETLKSYIEGEELTREDKVVLRGARKFLSEYIFGSLTLHSSEYNAMAEKGRLLPLGIVTLSNSSITYKFGKYLWKEKEGLRRCREYAEVIKKIEEGALYHSLLEEEKKIIEDCEKDFTRLWEELDRRMPIHPPI